MTGRSANSARGQLARDEPATRELANLLRAELGDPACEPAHFLDRVFALRPAAWLRRMPGRETFAHGEGIVFKRYRGDLWNEWWHDWARLGARRSPARRESENLAALRDLGLCVPAPLAWSEEASARAAPLFSAGRSAVAMELLAHSEHLRQCLARCAPQEVRAWTQPLARMVAQLHRGHWFHRDLYLQHFAVLSFEDRRLALLDCGRARCIEPVPQRWIVKDLAQLLHSCPENIPARVQLRWLVHYARERAARGTLELRSLAGLVLAKQRRMRAHRPRHLDPRTANADGSER